MNMTEWFSRKEAPHPHLAGTIPAQVTHQGSFRRRDGLTMTFQFKARTGTARFQCLHGSDIVHSLTCSAYTLPEVIADFRAMQTLSNRAPTQAEFDTLVGFKIA